VETSHFYRLEAGDPAGRRPALRESAAFRRRLRFFREPTEHAEFLEGPQITRNTKNTPCSGSVRRLPAAATLFWSPQNTQNTQNFLKARGARGSRRRRGAVTWRPSAAWRRRLPVL